MRIPLTGVGLFEYHIELKAMLLMVAITEATTDMTAKLLEECIWDPHQTIHRVQIERRR